MQVGGSVMSKLRIVSGLAAISLILLLLGCLSITSLLEGNSEFASVVVGWHIER